MKTAVCLLIMLVVSCPNDVWATVKKDETMRLEEVGDDDEPGILGGLMTGDDDEPLLAATSESLDRDLVTVSVNRHIAVGSLDFRERVVLYVRRIAFWRPVNNQDKH
jgi:hypothetical protein